MKKKVLINTEVNKLYYGFVIITLSSVHNQKLVDRGGKVVEICEGNICTEKSKYVPSKTLLKLCSR